MPEGIDPVLAQLLQVVPTLLHGSPTTSQVCIDTYTMLRNKPLKAEGALQTGGYLLKINSSALLFRQAKQHRAIFLVHASGSILACNRRASSCRWAGARKHLQSAAARPVEIRFLAVRGHRLSWISQNNRGYHNEMLCDMGG